MPDIEIRKATPSDVTAVLASQAALFAEDAAARDALRNAGWPVTHGRDWTERLIEDPDALVLVAVETGQLVGRAGGESVGGPAAPVVGHLIGTYAAPSPMWLAARAELLSMYVAPAARRLHIGARLVAGCTSWARSRGAARLHVSAYAQNQDAVRFYQASGFEPFSLELTQEL